MSLPPPEGPPRITWTPDLVRSRLKGLSLRRPEIEPAHAAYRDAAAVLASFDPASLAPASGTEPLAPVLSALLADCTLIRDDRGEQRWSLRLEIRGPALRGLLARQALSAALAANPTRPGEPLQRALEGYLLGNATPIERQTRPELLASLEVTGWLDGVVSGLPDRERLRQRLEMDDLLSPLRRLVGEHFQGRTAELARLHEHAGAIADASPLVVHAIGGMGKSTLLARLLLDRIEGANGEHHSFAYLDLDHPSLTADEPLTLLGEILRQIGVQHPAQRPACDAARREIGQALSDRRHTSSDTWEQSLAINALMAILREAGAEDGSFLLVLDTFEEVQYSSRAYIGELWRLLDALQRAIPRLRTVLAGRSPIDDFPSQALLLGDFDEPAGVLFLRSHGVASPAVARVVFQQIGGNPLTLRLAAEAIRREGLGANGVLDRAARTGLFVHVREAQIQGQLYDRILGHIHDPDVRKLAHPGLVLRLITPDLIAQVLARPCGVDVTAAGRAEALFRSLGREALVTTEGGALRHRPDVRRVMLDLLRADRRVKVAEIHALAAAYHAGRATLEDRAEEIYHRLCLGEDPARIDARWTAGVAPHLRGAIDEIPLRQRAYLASRLGVDLDAQSRGAADLADWERDAEKRVRERMRIGREEHLEAALMILAERDERAEQSPLLALEAEVLERLERWDEASRLAGAALAATSAGGDVEGRMEALRVAARLEERQSHHAACLLALDELSTLSLEPGREESFLRFGLDRLRISRHAGLDEPTLRRIEGEIAAATRRRPSEAVAEDPRLYGEIEVALGARYPDLRERLRALLDRASQPHEAPGGAAAVALTAPLSGEQLKRLSVALLAAFPRFASLAHLVRFDLEKNLHAISHGGSLGTTVFDLVRTAEAEGWTRRLLNAALCASPESAALRELASDLGLDVATQPAGAPRRAGIQLALEQVREVHAATVRIGLDRSRQALMTAIPADFVATLSLAPSPSAQLLVDLNALNQAGELTNGTWPLAIWLGNAVALAGPREESAIFQGALARLSARPLG